MARGGLRFSLSLIVSELRRHQCRHNDVISRFAKVVVQRCGLHPRPWTIIAYPLVTYNQWFCLNYVRFRLPTTWC